jgi:serine/threonine protein phosphatase PrpC
MLRVAEQYHGSDTGRQRRANEDSLMVRSPLFVVADGMGGAQAGEVASRVAAETFQGGLPDGPPPEAALERLVQQANARIHELSHANAEQAGMGTTLTAIYVGELEVAIAHVGDSRAYCLRDGQLLRLTDDHSLVDELLRQGRLTPEEAVEHPQRSVITRALGIEGTVEVDTRSFRGLAGDVYLICSDGLTTMLSEQRIAEILSATPRLRDAGEALIAAANEAGGRDNITVILLRLEEVGGDGSVSEEATMTGIPAVQAPPATDTGRGAARETAGAVAAACAPAAPPPRRPRVPAGAPTRPPARRRRLRPRHAGVLAATLVVLALLIAGALLALQSVYFIGTDDRGLVTLYQGVPFTLPGNVELFSSQYVSGVSASTIAAKRRSTLLDHSLRSEGKAASLIRSLELGQLE